MEERNIKRTEPRLDVFSALTVLERIVRKPVKLSGDRAVLRRTRFSVRTVLEWLGTIEHVKQRHRLHDEKHSGLGLRFDPKNPRWIFIPQVLTKDHIPAWILEWYDHDIVRNVRKNPDGSVDLEDMKRKRDAARLKRWGRLAQRTWSEFVVTGRSSPWTDELTRTRILTDSFYRGVECRRRIEGLRYILTLRGCHDRGRFGLTVGDGFDCDRTLKRAAAGERFGPLLTD